MNKKYQVTKSETPNRWVLADKENNIVIKWETGKFNETQNVTPLYDEGTPDMMKLARAMREIGDYLSINHSEKI